MKRIIIALLLISQARAQNIIFPLKASKDKHYIVDENSHAVFLKGSASWRLTYHVSFAQVKQYLGLISEKGFNTLILEITPDNGENNGGNFPDINGEYCFDQKDISKPNPKFFSHVDSILQLCKDMNFAVILFPLYLGCCHDGWMEILQERPNSVQKCFDYGQWIAKRYSKFNNIIWASGGDHNETPESVAFAEGIASIDSVHLHTYHTNPAYTSTERLPQARWLTLSSIYTYFPDMNVNEYQVYGQIYQEKLRNKRMPFFTAESAYEWERNENTQTLRRQAYWSVLSGSCGHIFGNRDTWVMNENWNKALESPGYQSMKIFHEWLQTFPWFQLEPDWQHLVFMSGRGNFNAGSNPGGEDYATGAMSKDQTLGMIYLPDARRIGVDMDHFTGPAKIKWFDPSNGAYTILQKTYLNKGIAWFEPPALVNAKGFGDWVLIIESSKTF